MSNPAFELSEVFTNWRDQIGPNNNKRLLHAVNIDTEEGANELIRVFALIARVSTAIDAAESQSTRGLDIYRADVQKWVRIAAGRDASWSSVTTDDAAVPSSELKDLQRLGHYLDGKVLEVDAASEATIRSLLSDIEEMTRESDLSPELTKYALTLLRDISASLDGEELGFGFELGEALRRLWVCLGAAETEAKDPETKKRFSKLRSVIIPNVTTGVVTQAILQAGSVVVGEIAANTVG